VVVMFLFVSRLDFCSLCYCPGPVTTFFFVYLFVIFLAFFALL